MSFYYTPPVLTGYNQDPPPDDGRMADTNRVKWASHVTKLGDPLKTFLEAVDTELQGAFGKLLFSSFVDITGAGSFNIDAAAPGRVYSVDPGRTAVLPAPGAGVGEAAEGFVVAIRSVNPAWGVSPGVTVTAAPDNYTIPQDGWMLAASDGTRWHFLVGGGSLAVTGYEGSSSQYTLEEPPELVGGGAFDAAFDIPLSTWESYGPTGSGATNTWALLDALRPGYKAIEVGVAIDVIGTGLISHTLVWRPTGSSKTIVGTDPSAAGRVGGVDGAAATCRAVIVCDAEGRFDLARAKSGTVSSTSAYVTLLRAYY